MQCCRDKTQPRVEGPKSLHTSKFLALVVRRIGIEIVDSPPPPMSRSPSASALVAWLVLSSRQPPGIRAPWGAVSGPSRVRTRSPRVSVRHTAGRWWLEARGLRVPQCVSPRRLQCVCGRLDVPPMDASGGLLDAGGQCFLP